MEIPADLLTPAEREQAAILERNARIRAAYRERKRRKEKIAPWMVEESERLGLTLEAFRFVIYRRSSEEERPWLEEAPADQLRADGAV